MSVDIGVPNGVDVRRTSSKTAQTSPPNQAVTAWGAGTQLVRILGNVNRAVGWKIALVLAASHVAGPHTQVTELSQHPIIRQALRDRGGQDPILGLDSSVPIPIDLAARILSNGTLNLRPDGQRDEALDLEFSREVWVEYGEDIIAYENDSRLIVAESALYVGHGRCIESRLRVDAAGVYHKDVTMQPEVPFLDQDDQP